MSGFIKLHRKLCDWEWYTDANTFRVFMHCLLKANYVDKKHRGTIVKRGEFLTSYEVLSFELKLTVQKVRTSLTNLELTKEITRKSTSKGTKISICNYDTYQLHDSEDNKPVNNQITNDQQSNNNQITTTKKEKNLKEVIKKKSIVVRKKEFWENSQSAWNKLGGLVYLSMEELISFGAYWCEYGEDDIKMRYEKEKSFGISRRLGTWKKNNFNNNGQKPQSTFNSNFLED